jgi:hypothetical protein
MTELHDCGLLVDLNEDATMYDAATDDGARAQFNLAQSVRHTEKYMYMAIR